VIAFVNGGLYDAGPYNAASPLGGLALQGGSGFPDGKPLTGGIVAVPEPSGIIMIVALAGTMSLLRRRKPI